MKIKGILLDVNNQTAEVLEIENDFKYYYRIIDSEWISFHNIRIGRKYYYIALDDNGLLKPNYVVSGVSRSNRYSLAGNLFIIKFNGKEDLISLTKADIAHIRKHIFSAPGYGPLLIID